MKVVVSPTARRQLHAFAAWWDEHRPEARFRVEDALDVALGVLAEHPDIGRSYSADPRYRTWRLKGTPYFLFYRVDERAETIWVVVAWSGTRGARPHLP